MSQFCYSSLSPRLWSANKPGRSPKMERNGVSVAQNPLPTTSQFTGSVLRGSHSPLSYFLESVFAPHTSLAVTRSASPMTTSASVFKCLFVFEKVETTAF